MPAPVDRSFKLGNRDDVGMKVAAIAPSMLYLLYPLQGKQAHAGPECRLRFLVFLFVPRRPHT